MPDDDSSKAPSTDPQSQPLSQPPVTPSTPHQGTLGEGGNANSKDKQNQTRELANQFRIAEKWQIGTTVGLGVIGIFALFIYYGQLCEMKKVTKATENAATAAKGSLDLTRQVVKGTQAAICHAIPGLGTTVTSMYVQIRNDGKVSAIQLQATFSITRKSLPDGKVIGLPQRIEISRGQLPPDGKAGKYFALGGFSKRDFGLLQHIRQTIIVQGAFQYDNGFGDVVHESMCMQLIGSRHDDGRYNGVEWPTCDYAPERLRQYMEADKRKK